MQRNLVVAENVRVEMVRNRTTQHMLAAAMGKSQQSISRRLAGRTPFTLAELDVVAHVLDVPVAALIGEPSAVAS